MEEDFYRLAQRLVGGWARWYFPVNVEGLEHLPPRGGLLVAGNHHSFLDPALIGSFLPRPVHFLMNHRYFRFPLLHSIVSALGALPVGGEGERASLRSSLRILSKGGVVGIFPQGQRVAPGEKSQAAPGLGFLARVGRVPVLPVGIRGTEQSLPPGRRWPARVPVTIRLRPVIPPPARRTEEEAFAERVLAAAVGGE